MVVTHHPFDLPEGFDESDIVGRAGKAVPLMADCGADVFLSGHLHISHIVHTAKRYPRENGQSALVIQAGTATSVRGRGEAHSFNLLEFEHPQLLVVRLELDSGKAGFEVAESQAFEHGSGGWRVAGGAKEEFNK